jgi:hypothetical protein
MLHENSAINGRRNFGRINKISRLIMEATVRVAKLVDKGNIPRGCRSDDHGFGGSSLACLGVEPPARFCDPCAQSTSVAACGIGILGYI